MFFCDEGIDVKKPRLHVETRGLKIEITEGYAFRIFELSRQVRVPSGNRRGLFEPCIPNATKGLAADLARLPFAPNLRTWQIPEDNLL